MAEAEADVDTRIADLETKLFHNVYQYELHLKYIKCLKEKGNFMKLRHARERFSKHFPLSEELWMQWIKDEECIDISLKQLQYIKELFDRAHLDYLCPDLWVEEVRFFLEHLKERNAFGTKPDDEEDDSDSNDDDNDDDDDEEDAAGKEDKQANDMDTNKDKKTLVTISFVREICENAVAACSKHFAKAGAVFDQYELFEFAVLEHTASLGDAEALEEQKRRITALHRRRFGLPHRGLSTGWASFIQWLAVQGLDADEKAKQRYNRAADKADHYEHLEALLAAEDAGAQRDAYMRYIEEEKKEGAERAATAYERAVAAFPLDTPLWIDYLVFLTTTGKAAQALPLVARAWRRSVRNCPWSSELWRHRIAQEERSGAAYMAVKAVLEEALQMPFQTPQDYVRVWLAFCHFCFRRSQAESVVKTDADEDVVETWRMAVAGAKEYVAQYLQAETPGYNTICLYEAKMEALRFSNLERAHTVMEELLRIGTFGKELETWLAFYQFERIAAGVAGARKVLQRAVQFVRDAPESAVQLYTQFEDENGTLADVDEAARRSQHALQMAAAAKKKAEAKRNKKGGDKKLETKQRSKRKQGERNTQQQQQQQQQQHQKGGRASASTANVVESREAEGEELHRKRAKVTSNESAHQQQQKETLEQGGGSDTTKQATAAGDGQGKARGAQQHETPAHPASDPQTAKRTVFVKNLDFSVDEDMLRSFFKDCGSIREIRLVRKASGKSKGFAYIEFEEKSSLSFALSKDRQFLHGRPVLVDPCVDRSKVALKPKHKPGYDPRTVFVKSLDYSSTEEEVRKLFEQYGPLKEVRMMTTLAGKPRGFAYVEFEASRDAASAIMNLDKMQFKGRTLQVSLSNPPSSAQGRPAAAGKSAQAGGAGTPSLSSSSAFQPRSVRKAQRSGRGRLALDTATPSSASDTSDAGVQQKEQKRGEGAGKPKSNADFLAMMLQGKKGSAQ